MGAGMLTRWLTQRVSDVMQPVPAAVAAAERPTGVLARLIAAEGAAEVVVVDGAGRAVGLFEAVDLLPHLGPTAARSPTVEELVDRQALMAADEPLVEAVARMRRFGRERAAVADATGRPIGVLRLSNALAAGFGPMLAALEAALGGEGAQLKDLARAKAAQTPLALAMLEDGRQAIEVQAVLGALNDRLVGRVVAGAVQAMATDGWGEPPVPFTLIQMGSAGRCESFLAPDQDHGFILHDYPDARHRVIDAWFIALAERVARDLDRVGYALCDGHVMATNPLWRKPLRAWLDQVLYWTRSRSNQAILQADIFFDFRPVYGPPGPAAELRRHVTEVVRDARPFLAQMCWRQREQGSPLGLFGHLGPDSFDLKLWASLPLVELPRIMALAHGIPETGTVARLDALAATDVLPGDLHEALVEDHRFLADLRLRSQLERLQAGQTPTNVIAPRALSAGTRERLEGLFRDVERLRRKVLSELLGAVA